MSKRFKGLDLTKAYVKNYGQRFVTLYRRRWSKPYPRKWNAKRQNGCLKPFQIAEKRREVKGKRKKERYTHLNAQFQSITRKDKKAILSDQCKEKRKTTEWERPEISSRKLEIAREYFMQSGDNKGQKGMDPTEAEEIRERWQEYTEEL